MKRILIVANQTAGGAHLQEIVRSRHLDGPAEFVLLVPATPPATGLTWTQVEAKALARSRMNDAVESLRTTGASVRGVVGDARPLDAIDDALRHESFTEIIVSTFPAGVSRWLRQGLPQKARSRFGVEVTHVIDAAQVLARTAS